MLIHLIPGTAMATLANRPRFQLNDLQVELPELDPTLDPCALTPLEPRPDFRLTWGVTGMLVAGLGAILLTIKVAPLVLPTEARKTVAISLLPGEPDPVVVEEGGGARAGGGDDAIDPQMALRVDRTLQPRVQVPETLEPLPQAPSSLVFGVTDLPQVPGGTGLQRGAGEGTGGSGSGNGRGGRGNILGHMGSSGPDFRLVVIQSDRPLYRLPPKLKVEQTQVSVEVLVAMDGSVTSARVLSGLPMLHASAVSSAMKYRFEPLEPHGFKTPVRLTIHFNYREVGS